MIDAAKYLESGTLKNGTAVRIRAIRADDKSRLSEAFRALDSETIYKRFFRHKSALTNKELKAATEVDFKNEVALVVTIGEGESETIIGGARYAAFDEAGNERDAEVAFTVEEDYHRSGHCRPTAAASSFHRPPAGRDTVRGLRAYRKHSDAPRLFTQWASHGTDGKRRRGLRHPAAQKGVTVCTLPPTARDPAGENARKE